MEPRNLNLSWISLSTVSTASVLHGSSIVRT